MYIVAFLKSSTKTDSLAKNHKSSFVHNVRQTVMVGIPMGTNCAPLVADLFLFCYERDFMTSLSGVKQAEIIEAFKSTSRYLDDLLNIDNPYFEGMVNRIYPPELQLNKASTVATPIFLSKTVLPYRFRIVFESYRFMRFYAVSNAV